MSTPPMSRYSDDYDVGYDRHGRPRRMESSMVPVPVGPPRHPGLQAVAASHWVPERSLVYGSPMGHPVASSSPAVEYRYVVPVTPAERFVTVEEPTPYYSPAAYPGKYIILFPLFFLNKNKQTLP